MAVKFFLTSPAVIVSIGCIGSACTLVTLRPSTSTLQSCASADIFPSSAFFKKVKWHVARGLCDPFVSGQLAVRVIAIITGKLRGIGISNYVEITSGARRAERIEITAVPRRPAGGLSTDKLASIIKKWRGAFRSNATVQVLPGLAGDVPSPSLIMPAKSQQTVKANGA
jgi:hypothetical protein